MKALNEQYSLLSEQDIYHIKEGSEYRLFDKLGSHYVTKDGKEGIYFAVWAPNAKYISVIGDFNNWDKGAHKMNFRNDGSGIWECFISNVQVPEGSSYKYYLESKFHNYKDEKSDPHAFYWEKPPRSATRTWKLDYEWNDNEWMGIRGEKNSLKAPVSIYEMHLGSWKRKVEDNRSLTYRELAEELPLYLKDLGFTHVEFLPVTEHPFDGSWGYQTLGYYAPTSRFGTPQDFMYLVDKLHQAEIGVIFDWVPSHFAVDMHGLANFDGTNIYEHADEKQGFHPEWGSSIFNLERNEVNNFLISSALFWFEKYHIDGIRVDAVTSMLYLDYGREDGEWVANKYGGKENLDAVKFLQTLNYNIYEKHNDVMMIAEESTAWPMVTSPTYIGGLGFEYKWNMGWMHDTLKYMSIDPVLKKYHQNQITFSIWYAYNEQFLLALSHDEVVHMKGSLINKMPGDKWQKFANLRIMYGYMFAHPGKKLLFMGSEFAQFAEWNYETSLDWHLLENGTEHKQVYDFLKTVQALYKSNPSLYVNDYEKKGFSWIDSSDSENSVVSFIRSSDNYEDTIIVVCNFTPIARYNYKIGVPEDCEWEEILNSDSEVFGGSNVGNLGVVKAVPDNLHGFEASMELTLPPLSILWFKKSNNKESDVQKLNS